MENCITGPTNRRRLCYLYVAVDDVLAMSAQDTHSPWVGSPVRRPERPRRNTSGSSMLPRSQAVESESHGQLHCRGGWPTAEASPRR
jgi:hypothetical protein